MPSITESEMGDIPQLLDVLTADVPPMQFQVPDSHRLLAGMREILARHGTANVDCRLDECDYLTSAPLVDLFKSYADVPCTVENDHMSYLREWIRASMSVALRATEIARTSHLGVDYLTALFNQSTGVTPPAPSEPSRN